jgi:hypothetical protein
LLLGQNVVKAQGFSSERVSHRVLRHHSICLVAHLCHFQSGLVVSKLFLLGDISNLSILARQTPKWLPLDTSIPLNIDEIFHYLAKLHFDYVLNHTLTFIDTLNYLFTPLRFEVIIAMGLKPLLYLRPH